MILLLLNIDGYFPTLASNMLLVLRKQQTKSPLLVTGRCCIMK